MHRRAEAVLIGECQEKNNNVRVGWPSLGVSRYFWAKGNSSGGGKASSDSNQVGGEIEAKE